MDSRMSAADETPWSTTWSLVSEEWRQQCPIAFGLDAADVHPLHVHVNADSVGALDDLPNDADADVVHGPSAYPDSCSEAPRSRLRKSCVRAHSNLESFASRDRSMPGSYCARMF